jgi:hypothetical protein
VLKGYLSEDEHHVDDVDATVFFSYTIPCLCHHISHAVLVCSKLQHSSQHWRENDGMFCTRSHWRWHICLWHNCKLDTSHWGVVRLVSRHATHGNWHAALFWEMWVVMDAHHLREKSYVL